MKPYPQSGAIDDMLRAAKRVVIMQADNPDADSLGSALALEHILGDMGKEPYLYCGVDIPAYLAYLPGWDRVSSDMPRQFDLSIIVDTSADSLFERLNASALRREVAKRPCIVIDHHAVDPTIPYASIVCSPKAVATGEVIYELATALNWPLSLAAAQPLATAIMSDSLGLTSEGTSARSIFVVAELVSSGVSLARIEHDRRQLMRKDPEIIEYKGRLLQHIEYHADGRVASITIPWEEIERYSHAYNPSMLVLDDMRFATNVDVAIAFKLYKDGKITAKIRCNYGRAIAADLAKHFGGGGHPYASGFKITDGRPLTQIKAECFALAAELLNHIDKGTNPDEFIQYADTSN